MKKDPIDQMDEEENREQNGSEQASAEASASKEDLDEDLESKLIELRQENFELAQKLATASKKASEYELKIVDIREYVKKMELEINAVRERAKRDQAIEVERQLSNLILPLLEVVDNFERSLANSSDSLEPSFLEGIEMIYKNLLSALQKVGVEKIPAKGENFDPEIHEAVGTMPVQSEEEDSKVLEVAREGYRLSSRVIRPAQVLVGKF